jgi:uncharacterized protein YbbK (DUF523 family)
VSTASHDANLWAARLKDQRSRRVVFVSHCLLNQNVRYLGGASQPGVVTAAVEPFIRDGVGICQMPCPEQAVWGGVTKRVLLRAYGSERTALYRLRGILLPAFLAYTRQRYRPIARRVAAAIADYVGSGFEVVGVVGVGDSPSCGVVHTLDVRRALPVVASFDPNTIERAAFNDRAVRACIVRGRGMFIEALQRELVRRGLEVPFREHDPLATKDG